MLTKADVMRFDFNIVDDITRFVVYDQLKTTNVEFECECETSRTFGISSHLLAV